MLYVVRMAPILLLVACAAGPTPTTGAVESTSNEVIVCGKEEPTASRLKVRRCWTRETADQEERDAEALVKRGQIVRPASNAPGAGR